MGKTLHGKISGRSIALDEDPGMPEGTAVVVEISPDRRAALMRLAGAWKDDPSLDEIFREMLAERHAERRPEVKFE